VECECEFSGVRVQSSVPELDTGEDREFYSFSFYCTIIHSVCFKFIPTLAHTRHDVGTVERFHKF